MKIINLKKKNPQRKKTCGTESSVLHKVIALCYLNLFSHYFLFLQKERINCTSDEKMEAFSLEFDSHLDYINFFCTGSIRSLIWIRVPVSGREMVRHRIIFPCSVPTDLAVRMYASIWFGVLNRFISKSTFIGFQFLTLTSILTPD